MRSDKVGGKKGTYDSRNAETKALVVKKKVLEEQRKKTERGGVGGKEGKNKPPIWNLPSEATGGGPR